MTLLEADEQRAVAEVLPALPSRRRLWWRVFRTLLRRRKEHGDVPALSVEVPALHVDPHRLQAYRAVCGFEHAVLPVTYPQVQAAALQMHLLTRPEFPLPLLGVVHVRNTIRLFQALDPAKVYRVRVDVQSGTIVPSGIEFPVVVRYYDKETLVWEAVATGLCRTRRRGTGAKWPSAAQEVERFEACATFDVPSDIGRRYGRVSGDRNPIHLWPLGGRLFGYPSHIAHGMWCLARCLVLLHQDAPPPPVEIQVKIRQPLFLPARVTLWRSQSADSLEFGLTTADRARLHLRGSIRPAFSNTLTHD
jgi:acyl dehydratase